MRVACCPGVQTTKEQRKSDRAHASAELREQTLLELAKRDGSDLPATCRAVTEAAATLVDVARASVWRFVGDALVCDDLFLRDDARHTSGQIITRDTCPAYFAFVAQSMVLVARDAHVDPRTTELDASYLVPLGIGAMLDTPIWAGGLAGVLCCEHVGSSRRWTGREERDAARLADIVAVSMERSARRAVEERSRIILEAIPQYVIVTDREGRPVDTSAIARRALEEDAGTSAMSRFQDLELRSLAGDLLPRSQWPGERARRGETVRGEIVEIGSRVTGEKRWLRATGAPVTVDGDVQGAVIIYEEVAEEIRIERVKREVLAAVAHELRTPTTIVKGYAQRLQKTSGRTDDELRALAAMERAATRIERLAEALVDLTAITLGRIVLAMEHADLGKVALDAIGVAHGTSTHVVRFTPSATPARVFIDPLRTRRVVCELVENAARWSNAGSEIDVTLRVEDGLAEVCVADRGMGIAAEAQPHVFEPFFRAHVGTSNDVGGLGIGLFLAREIIVRQGGSIAFHSEEARGTTFTVRLPLDGGAG